MKASKSLIVFILCCSIFAGSPFLTKRWENTRSNAVISWDIYGYWFYLPSFFYDKLGELRMYDYIQNEYHPGADVKDLAFVQPSTRRYVMNYPMGQAIMDLPAFAVGHLWARLTGDRTDGFSRPYQISLAFWCVIVSCFGIWILRRLLLRYFEDWLVAIVLLIVCVGTNLYNFVSFSPMTHAFLFTVYACLVYLTDSFYRDQKFKLWRVLLIGLLSGLATITRPTEIICVLIPLLWGVGSLGQMTDRLKLFYQQIWIIPVYIFGAFAAAFPQLIYWKKDAGQWLFFSYHGADKTFSFLAPHVMDVLFSYKKGWFMYTPVMVLAIIGFYQLFRYYRPLFWCVLTFTIANIYLISAWDCWWYGGSFSMRPMIQSYTLLMFPMAAFLNDFLRKPWLKYFVLAFLLFCIWLNLLMTYQSNIKDTITDGEHTTKEYYWAMFGKTSVTIDDQKLLDNDERIPARIVSSLKTIYTLDTGAKYENAMAMYYGRKAFRLDTFWRWTDIYKIPGTDTIKKGWYRAYAQVYFPDKEWVLWDQTQFMLSFQNKDSIIKQKMIRVQRITEQGRWHDIYMDIQVPHTSDHGPLIVRFWLANSVKLFYMTDLRVDYTPEE